MTEDPPFSVTSGILNSVGRISELVGAMTAANLVIPPKLRRQNQVKSITGPLGIEGNTLTEEQVTAILDGKQVMAAAEELAEVKGAIRAYEALPDWDPTSLDDVCTAHGTMMGDVLSNAGNLRKSGVRILKGDEMLHIAPPADRVRGLINSLLAWLKPHTIHWSPAPFFTMNSNLFTLSRMETGV